MLTVHPHCVTHAVESHAGSALTRHYMPPSGTHVIVPQSVILYPCSDLVIHNQSPMGTALLDGHVRPMREVD